MKPILPIAGAALLAACASTGNMAGPCDADPAQGLVGEIATSALGQRAMQLTGAEELRWIPPDTAVTMDYRPTRLNIEYDGEQRVTAIRCG